MTETSVTIVCEVELCEPEAALLFDYCQSNRTSLPEGIRALLLDALMAPAAPTSDILPFDPDPTPATHDRLTVDTSLGMPEPSSDSNPHP